ncbi:CHAD domain-containing protein [Roseimicrobium gellanilyticum]|uniref:CHAD domain-containing protein n=1 Tax=Roseimicrobium gellanilyticum TaxID=748857 RepID=A0A366HFH0_9BACT|nr:CHAD domain-containing protein [Roseimicrobium gellanilyticum]RBP40454.1 CHAD domain-containing protein [Roseimicrobium gellanilyticum]
MSLDLESTASTRSSHSHAGRWLHRLLTQLVQQSTRDIHKVPQWEEQGVHSLRKRMKKLQAMLRLAAPVAPESSMKSVLRDVRDLKNLLSGQRDTLVLTKLARKLDTPVPDLHAEFQSSGGKVRKAMLLSEQLLIDIGLLDLSQLTWDMVGAMYVKSYKASRRAWRRAQEDPSAENLHDWRKKVKRLYYQSTALERWLHHPKRLRRTRKLGSLLGDCHDLDVFNDSVQTGRIHPESGWKSKVKQERSSLLSRIEQRAEKAFSRPSCKIKTEMRHALP